MSAHLNLKVDCVVGSGTPALVFSPHVWPSGPWPPVKSTWRVLRCIRHSRESDSRSHVQGTLMLLFSLSVRCWLL